MSTAYPQALSTGDVHRHIYRHIHSKMFTGTSVHRHCPQALSTGTSTGTVHRQIQGRCPQAHPQALSTGTSKGDVHRHIHRHCPQAHPRAMSTGTSKGDVHRHPSVTNEFWLYQIVMQTRILFCQLFVVDWFLAERIRLFGLFSFLFLCFVVGCAVQSGETAHEMILIKIKIMTISLLLPSSSSSILLLLLVLLLV